MLVLASICMALLGRFSCYGFRLSSQNSMNVAYYPTSTRVAIPRR